MKESQPVTGVVLGGSGFLGAWVVRTAQAAGTSIACLGRHPQLALQNPSPVVLNLTADLAQEGALEQALRDLRPDWIVNCAALSSLAECEESPGQAARLNRDFPRELAGYCAHRNIHLVHLSTDLVFDGEFPGEAGYGESDAPRPLSVYGKTKRAGEQEVLAADPKALVVRLPLLFGDSLGRGLGASDSLLKAIKCGARPQLFTDEFRSPFDVCEAAQALVGLATGSLAGLLHLAGPQRLSRHGLGTLVLEAAELSPQLIEAALQKDCGSNSPRPRDACLDIRRARSLLGFSPSFPREVLRKTAQDGSPP